MRNRQKRRELRRAGIRREQIIGARNAEHYNDPTPQDVVREIVKERRRRNG